MDTTLLTASLFAIIFFVFIISFDEAMILWMIAFLGIVIAFSLESIFDISYTSGIWTDQMIILIYWFVPIFAFVKSMFTAKDIGIMKSSRGRNG